MQDCYCLLHSHWYKHPSILYLYCLEQWKFKTLSLVKKTGYAVLILSAYLRWKHGPVFGYMGRENFDEKVNCLLRSLDRTAIWPCYLIVIGTFFFLPDPIIKPCRAPLDRFQGTRDVKTIGFGIKYDRFGKSISIMLEESSVPALPPSRLNFEYSTSIP